MNFRAGIPSRREFLPRPQTSPRDSAESTFRGGRLVHGWDFYWTVADFICILGVVRLQSDAFESELKVRQKERVPSRVDTRLWLYKLHGPVQSEAFRFK